MAGNLKETKDILNAIGGIFEAFKDGVQAEDFLKVAQLAYDSIKGVSHVDDELKAAVDNPELMKELIGAVVDLVYTMAGKGGDAEE